MYFISLRKEIHSHLYSISFEELLKSLSVNLSFLWVKGLQIIIYFIIESIIVEIVSNLTIMLFEVLHNEILELD